MPKLVDYTYFVFIICLISKKVQGYYKSSRNAKDREEAI